MGTFCWRVGSVDRCLIDGLIRLRIIIPTEDVLIRWVDVGGVGLLVDERNDFIVVSDKRSCTWMSKEDVIAGMVVIEP